MDIPLCYAMGASDSLALEACCLNWAVFVQRGAAGALKRGKSSLTVGYIELIMLDHGMMFRPTAVGKEM